MATPQFRVILPQYISEGARFGVGFQRLDFSRESLAQDIPVTMVLDPNPYENSISDADIGTTQRVFNATIPAMQASTYVQFEAQKDTLLEGPEKFRFYAYSPGAEQFNEYYEFEIADANKPQQKVEVTLLDKEVTFTEGETATIRMAISGNITGFEEGISIPYDSSLGEPRNLYNSFFSSGMLWQTEPLAPGQTYTELQLRSKEDRLRENDQVANLKALSYRPVEQWGEKDGYETTIAFKGSTKVTLLDDDWGTAPSNTNNNSNSSNVLINGNNNTVNIYNDNRSYNNSFNVNNTLNQVYDNRVTGTAQRDVLTGTTENDRVFGGWGNDVLRGAKGDDLIQGGKGDDRLFGGYGSNIFDGGLGRDFFNIAAERTAATADIIRDAAVQDRIVILNGTNLGFQQMGDGVGILSNGTLQALVQGDLTLGQVRSMTSIAAA